MSLKNILVAGIVLTYSFSSVWAYTPTPEDRELRNQARAYVDSYYPSDIEKLLATYTKLEAWKPYITVAYGERGAWFVEELQEIFVEQLFETNDVCIQSYVQAGDTVEVLYTVEDSAGQLLRETTTPLAFNPWAEQVWKTLDDSVYGLQEGDTLVESVDTLTVVANEEGEWTKTFERGAIDFIATPTIGSTYAFGSTTIPGAIIWTVSAVDETTVTFDFENAPTDEHVILRVGLETLRKGCTSA